MMMDSLIEYDGSLKNLKLESILIQKIKAELVESFPNIQLVKLNIDLVLQICNAIEKKRGWNFARSCRLIKHNKVQYLYSRSRMLRTKVDNIAVG